MLNKMKGIFFRTYNFFFVKIKRKNPIQKRQPVATTRELPDLEVRILTRVKWATKWNNLATINNEAKGRRMGWKRKHDSETPETSTRTIRSWENNLKRPGCRGIPMWGTRGVKHPEIFSISKTFLGEVEE